MSLDAALYSLLETQLFHVTIAMIFRSPRETLCLQGCGFFYQSLALTRYNNVCETINTVKVYKQLKCIDLYLDVMVRSKLDVSRVFEGVLDVLGVSSSSKERQVRGVVEIN